jgi:hypothetical protein
MNASNRAGAWTTVPEYLSIFPRIRLLELGSYAPQKMDTVKAVRDALIQNENLANARIVADFDSPISRKGETNGEYNLRKSEYWIPHADILLFLFLGQDTGVMYELIFALYKIPWASNRTIVAYDRNEHVTSLLAGLTSKYSRQISEISFEKIEDLCEPVAGVVAAISRIIYSDVIYRPLGEWELSQPR